MPRRRAWPELSVLQWRIVAETLVMLPLTAAALRIIGLRTLQALLGSSSPPRATVTESVRKEARSIAHLIRRVARRFPLRASCLQQSLVLCWQLRRRGIPSVVKIGVRKEVDALQAHAWVTCGDVVLADLSDVGQRFTPFSHLHQG